MQAFARLKEMKTTQKGQTLARIHYADTAVSRAVYEVQGAESIAPKPSHPRPR